MNRKAVYFVAVWLMCTSTLFAEQARSWLVLPVPIMFYGPSTGIAGGVMGIVDFGQNRIQAGGLYTQKRQSLAFAEGRFFFRGDDLLLVNQLAFSYFPRVFYGIGPQADMKEQYTPRDVRIESFLGIQVAENLYIGPFYRFLCSDIVKTEGGGLLEYGQVGGSDGTIISGGGARLIWDRRDHELFPRRGTYLDVETGLFRTELGSRENFALFVIDARCYLPLFERQVLAFQYLLKLSGGEVPLQALPDLGGQSVLRGYKDRRYLDKVACALQGEYRFPIFWRFGGSLFGALGQVASSMSGLDFQDIKLAGGGGLRIAIDQKRHISLRIDCAFSPNDSGLYFGFGEAF